MFLAHSLRWHSGLTLALSGAGPGAFECRQNRASGIHSSALVGPRHVLDFCSFLLRRQPNMKPTAPQTRGNAGKADSPTFLKFVPVGNTNGAIKPKRAEPMIAKINANSIPLIMDSVVMWPNEQDHRPGATDVRHGTEALSPGSVDPLVMSSGYQTWSSF